MLLDPLLYNSLRYDYKGAKVAEPFKRHQGGRRMSQEEVIMDFHNYSITTCLYCVGPPFAPKQL